jgi:hypothetical protein
VKLGPLFTVPWGAASVADVEQVLLEWQAAKAEQAQRLRTLQVLRPRLAAVQAALGRYFIQREGPTGGGGFAGHDGRPGGGIGHTQGRGAYGVNRVPGLPGRAADVDASGYSSGDSCSGEGTEPEAYFDAQRRGGEGHWSDGGEDGGSTAPLSQREAASLHVIRGAALELAARIRKLEEAAAQWQQTQAAARPLLQALTARLQHGVALLRVREGK